MKAKELEKLESRFINEFTDRLFDDVPAEADQDFIDDPRFAALDPDFRRGIVELQRELWESGRQDRAEFGEPTQEEFEALVREHFPELLDVEEV